MLKSIILLLRPHQWLKNLFIFLPLFFDRQLDNVEVLSACFWAFIVYSLAASAIYCFNDIWDVEADKLHPVKYKRPIASGKVSKGFAYFISLVCIITSLLISYIPTTQSNKAYLLSIIIIGYFLINLTYCIWLKHIAIVDVFIIAIGFVLRILAGGVSAQIHLSHWIILMTFLLALFLAFAKRRDDVVMYEKTGVAPRRNVNRYNLAFMNQAIAILASVTMVCYIMYTVSEEVVERMHTPYLYATSIFVLAGIIRYLQLAIVDVKSGSPTKVLMKDRFMQCCIVSWVIIFYLILYL